MRNTLKECSEGEHDIFANLASKWLSIALVRETRFAIDLDRFDDDGGAPSVSIAAGRPKLPEGHPSGMAIGKQKARESVSSKVRMLACVAQQPSVCSGSTASMIETRRPANWANDREMRIAR